MKFPDTAKLAGDAFAATGSKTHAEFCELMQGAVALRTFRRWLAGDIEATGLVRLVLRAVRDGWRPGPEA